MTTREADRPRQLCGSARARSASLPASYTTTRGTTMWYAQPTSAFTV